MLKGIILGIGNFRPSLVQGNEKSGSGSPPNQLYVANVGLPGCHSGVLFLLNFSFKSQSIAQILKPKTMHHDSKGSTRNESLALTALYLDTKA